MKKTLTRMNDLCRAGGEGGSARFPGGSISSKCKGPEAGLVLDAFRNKTTLLLLQSKP